jgi:hypothetical protein
MAAPAVVSEDAQTVTGSLAQALNGRYRAVLHGVCCELDLHVNAAGCLVGLFTADTERLEVKGGVPSFYGEVFGVILATDGALLAVFRASPHANDLAFEVDIPGDHNLMQLANAQRVIFERTDF